MAETPAQQVNEPDGPNVARLRGNNIFCQHGSTSRKCETCFAEAERDDHAITIKAIRLALQASEERAERLAAQVAAWKNYDDDSHDERPWGAGCRRDCTKCAALRAARALNDQAEPHTQQEEKP